MSAFTAAQLAKEAERELRYRRWVYSKWIGEGRIKADLAEVRINMMEEIFERLQREAEAEEQQWRLV